MTEAEEISPDELIEKQREVDDLLAVKIKSISDQLDSCSGEDLLKRTKAVKVLSEVRNTVRIHEDYQASLSDRLIDILMPVLFVAVIISAIIGVVTVVKWVL